MLLALTSAFAIALYYVYTSQVMKARPGLSSGITLAASHLSAGLALAPLWLWRSTTPLPVTSDLVTPLLATAGLLVLSRELYFYAYARTDVANITVFSALTPVYAIATGYLLLGEHPSRNALAGLLLICGSIYLLFMRGGASPLEPFRRIAHSRPIFCAFLSTIPTAFAAAFQKQLLASMDPVGFSFFLLSLIGLAALAIALPGLRRWKLQWRAIPWHFWLVSAVMLPLTHVLFCLVMLEQHMAISLVLQRSGVLFQIVLAYLFLHERQDIRKRLLVAAGIIAGFALIMA